MRHPREQGYMWTLSEIEAMKAEARVEGEAARTAEIVAWLREIDRELNEEAQEDGVTYSLAPAFIAHFNLEAE